MLKKPSKMARDSIADSAYFIGILSTLCTITGFSLNAPLNTRLNTCLNANHNIPSSIFGFIVFICGLFCVAFIFCLIACIVYNYKDRKYRDSVSLTIGNTPVEILVGDIFETDGLRVIGCDTHFDTRVDDDVISKTSLHGQLVLEHGVVDEIKQATGKDARRRNLIPNSDGLYDFPLGSIVKYKSTKDNHEYLMLAMTELNEQYEARSSMSQFEQMLMKMWREISRLYASNDVVLPILGAGITRFDGKIVDREDIIRCMLCTMNASGAASLNASVKIVIHKNDDKRQNIQLYEFKDYFAKFPK